MTESELASRLARLTLELVEIESPTGSETAAADHVEHNLRSLSGWTVERTGDSVLARFGSDTPAVVLVGHLDTVPANENPGPAIEGDTVVGLGASDMKGGLGVMLALAERAAESTSLGLVFYDREEGAYRENGLRDLWEPHPWMSEAELGLAMEPTGNALELGCVGTLNATITFTGQAAHSARPWLGDNAVHKAGPFLSHLAELAPRDVEDGPVCFREVINVTLAEGGLSRNVIPDHFALNVNFRFGPDRSPEKAESFLRGLLPEGTQVEVVDVAPGAPARADSPRLKTLIRDFDLTVRAKQAWTDVSQFAQHGVPAANFGPGLTEKAHQREEDVPIANLVRSYQVLSRFLRIS